MSFSSISNLNQYTTTQIANQAKTANTKTVGTAKDNKQVNLGDIAGRISSIPNLEKYEDLIKRFISGESEQESAGKPLTDDQIALRGLMREYMRTDTRSMSQIAMDMQQASKNFMNYWAASGNKGPMPGRVLSADGSFTIFNSKAEKDEFMKNQKLDFLKNVMSVINANKDGSSDKGTGFDMTV